MREQERERERKTEYPESRGIYENINMDMSGWYQCILDFQKIIFTSSTT